jgi:nucleotide-binding universal stress UspA family protein
VDIRDILLALRADAPCANILAWAAVLAARHDARIEGVCLYSEPVFALAGDFAVRQRAVAGVLDNRALADTGLIAPMTAAFVEVMGAHGVTAHWTSPPPDEPPATTAARARTADLAMVRSPDLHRPAQRALAWTLALLSGAPTLLVPDSARPAADFKRVVVAWNGSANAKRVLDASLSLLKRAAMVEIATVDDGPAGSPRAAPDALLSHLDRHGVRATFHHGGRDHNAGRAILARCAAVRADLLVMGAYGHWRIAEAAFGGVTETILTAAEIPVLMAH